VDEHVDTTRCHGGNNCQDNQRCLTHDLWQDLSNRIYGYLQGISLKDLLERRGGLAIASRQEEYPSDIPPKVSRVQGQAVPPEQMPR
jgi:Rrf2 family iron-sulfur cluster assembly transcriptional regulator